LLTLGNYFENYRNSTLLAPLFRLLRLCINFNKKVLGYILGDIFTNSSGHPVYEHWQKMNNRIIKIVFGQCLHFPFQHTSNAHNVIIHNLIAIFSLNNFTPWRESIPDLLFLRLMRRPLRHAASRMYLYFSSGRNMSAMLCIAYHNLISYF
jgi:hypothetical protein